MSALRAEVARVSIKGDAKPRISPPTPARSELLAFKATAATMSLILMPWQETAGRYITALGPDKKHLYREVCVVVARQNGKTTLAQPLIVKALLEGKKVMHIAQTRELPRRMFSLIANALSDRPELFPKRRGKVVWPRYGAGQEEILLENGGSYRIAASSTGGARGWSNDLVIVDELLEMRDFDSMSAIEPTLTMSDNPQLVYFSNAGSSESLVLNSVRNRNGSDPDLAYLEWSTAPEREPDDVAGWLQANPAFGHHGDLMRTLQSAYRKHRLAGTMAIFETEHLCRWVSTMQPRLVSAAAWEATNGSLETPLRPILGINMDPSGTRASGVIAWPQSDGTTALRVVADVTGKPIDLERFGPELRDLSVRLGVALVVHDPYSADLARYFREPKAMTGTLYINACERFVRLVESGKLRWDDAEAVGADLEHVSRKESGRNWIAVRTSDDRPVSAALAAIYAAWFASEPQQLKPRIY